MVQFRRVAALAVLGAALGMAGCSGGSGSTLGRVLSGSPRQDAIAAPAPQRPVVDQVVSLSADPSRGGVIVSAVGLPPTQGWWEADLVRVASADPSVAAFEFRLEPPAEPRPSGTQPSREVLAGTFLSRQDIAGIGAIVVRGRSNALSIRRP